MEAAEVPAEGTLQVVVSDRQVTRLGESVFRTGRVSQAAIEFTCNVLVSMAQKYKAVNAVAVRAVGTSALRDSGPPAPERGGDRAQVGQHDAQRTDREGRLHQPRL